MDLPPDGTPRALLPITERVLAWVRKERANLSRERESLEAMASGFDSYLARKTDDLRRIELCALAAREVALFHVLYIPEE